MPPLLLKAGVELPMYLLSVRKRRKVAGHDHATRGVNRWIRYELSLWMTPR